MEDAYEFAKHIPTHKLRVIKGANHCYTAHRKELSNAVVDFIISNNVSTNVIFSVGIAFAICSLVLLMGLGIVFHCRQGIPHYQKMNDF